MNSCRASSLLTVDRSSWYALQYVCASFQVIFFVHKEVFPVETKVQSGETQKKKHGDYSLHFYTDDLSPHTAVRRVKNTDNVFSKHNNNSFLGWFFRNNTCIYCSRYVKTERERKSQPEMLLFLSLSFLFQIRLSSQEQFNFLIVELLR